MHILVRTLSGLAAPLACLLLAGCGGDRTAGEPNVGASGGMQTPGVGGEPEAVPDPRLALHRTLGLDTFPVPLSLAPVVSARYNRTRKQALDRLIANLEGVTTRDAWLFAKEFFWRAPDDAVAPLIDAMDRVLVAPARRTHLENIVEAMGRMANPGLAPALLRASVHSEVAVRGKAIKAMVRSGDERTVTQAGELLPSLSIRDQLSWLEACRVHLGEAAVPIFEHMYYAESSPPALLDGLLDEALKMPPELASRVFERAWPTVQNRVKRRIAGARHAAGDLVGTRHLQSELSSGSSEVVAEAIGLLMKGEVDEVLEDLVRLIEHPDATVRATTAMALASLRSDNTTNLLLILTQDPDWTVKVVALKALAERGERSELERLYGRLQTAIGSELTVLLKALGEIRDGGCADVLLERFRAAPADGRPFLQAMAYTRSPEVFAAMREVFLGAEHRVAEQADGRFLTTINYVPKLMVNLRGAELALVGLFQDLDAGDTARRAWMLDCLGQIAADRDDPTVDEVVTTELREVLFDRSESPGMRLLAFQMLQRSMTLEDAMRLKLRLAEEAPPMAQAFSDLLQQYF